MEASDRRMACESSPADPPPKEDVTFIRDYLSDCVNRKLRDSSRSFLFMY